MRKISIALTTLIFTLFLVAVAAARGGEKLDLPWREAGLSEREAAAHLLDRFAHGPRPGEVDRVVEMGLETWLERQLSARLAEPELEARLEDFRSLEMSTREIAETYPNPGLVLIQARRDGVSSEEMTPTNREEMSSREMRQSRRALFAYAREKGYRPQRELLGELMTQKLYRAVYAENQLREVLTDFWFNHFNVSLTDNEVRPYLTTYERDAIRPHVLGDFREMLGATARHPAMLLYLDNARSVAEEGAPTTLEARLSDRRGGRGGRFGAAMRERMRARAGAGLDPDTRQQLEARRASGINENYARELLELHTLGVDGGYTQDDVVEVARAFTGWATYPPGPMRERIEERMERARRFGAGFVFEDDFLFRADAHDAGEKVVLGRYLEPGRGIEDGEEVLDVVAAHPSTARHLARKFAVRFVSDDPPEALVERLATDFRASGGDLRQLAVTLVESPEFWGPEARRQKIKSPFELAASALRSIDADVENPRGTIEWISKMGQPLYAYQAPTGYPDRADAWVNTGALLHRMNFGLELASGEISGVDFDLPALDHGREPESVEAALETWVPLLLPERDPTETVELLRPVVRDPEFASKVAAEAPEAEAEPLDDEAELMLFFSGDLEAGDRELASRGPTPGTLGHVVGVILGSPEFQRR